MARHHIERIPEQNITTAAPGSKQFSAAAVSIERNQEGSTWRDLIDQPSLPHNR
jgi:hypothetical protein